jgi:hypothetical protein
MLPVPQKNQVFEFQKNQPVMEQVKKQRQPAEPMDVITILEKSTGDQKQAIKLYNTLAKLVGKDPDFRVMRANNTLFIYNNNKNGSVDLAMETADTPRDLVDSIKQFKQAMKVAGFKTARFDIDNPQIIKVLKMGGIDIKTQPSGTVLEDGVTPGLIGIGEF